MTQHDAYIDVRLFAGLETLTHEMRGHVRVPVEKASTIAALCECLGLAPAAVGLQLVNGLHVRPDDVLQAGDEVSLFPPLGGG